LYISRLYLVALSLFLPFAVQPGENDHPIKRWSNSFENGIHRAVWWKNVGQWTYSHWKPLLATGCATSIAAGFACYKLHQKGINTSNFLAMGLCGYTFYWYVSDQETKKLIVDSTNRLLDHQDAAERRADKKLRILYSQANEHQRNTHKKIDRLDKNLRHALFASEIKIRAHISKESARLHLALAEHKQDILAQIIKADRHTTQNFSKLHQEVVGVGQFAQAQSYLMQSNIVALSNELPKIENSIITSTNHTGSNIQQMLQAMAQAQGIQVNLTSEPFETDEHLDIHLAPPSDYEPIIHEKFAELETEYEKKIEGEKAKAEEKIGRTREKLLKQQLLFAQELEQEHQEMLEKLALDYAQEDTKDPFDAIPEVKQFEAPMPLHDKIKKLAPFALQAIAPATALVLEKLLAHYWHYTGE
jgi:hypothetical protein